MLTLKRAPLVPHLLTIILIFHTSIAFHRIASRKTVGSEHLTMPTLLTTTLSLYLAWAAALSDSLFHRVWSVALFLFSLLTTAIFNSRVSVSTVPLAVLDLLIFALCIALSPAQLLLHPAKSVDQKDKALDTLFPKSDEDKRESLFTESVLPFP